jgi:hypothetical protein
LPLRSKMHSPFPRGSIRLELRFLPSFWCVPRQKIDDADRYRGRGYRITSQPMTLVKFVTGLNTPKLTKRNNSMYCRDSNTRLCGRPPERFRGGTGSKLARAQALRWKGRDLLRAIVGRYDSAKRLLLSPT